MTQHTSDTHPVAQKLRDAVAYIRTHTDVVPALGIVAGSGLSALGDLIEDAVRLPFGDIPHMHAPTVVGHTGELVIGTLGGLPTVVLSGRVHGYEGHPMEDLVFGVRMLASIGTKRVLLTNAAGGIQPWLTPGTLCRLVDHINMSGQNPLIGKNVDSLGPRFPDMSHAYDPTFGGQIQEAAASAGVDLQCGIYASVTGPSYETPAEIRMLRTIGASLVGMSTVPECIALNHMGVIVGGISCVTNHAAGVSPKKLDHSEVKEVANEAGPRLLALVTALATQLAASEGS